MFKKEANQFCTQGDQKGAGWGVTTALSPSDGLSRILQHFSVSAPAEYNLIFLGSKY